MIKEDIFEGNLIKKKRSSIYRKVLIKFESFKELSVKLRLFFHYLFIQRAEDLVKIL